MKAMIFAAGLGTRLQPLTNDRPKALVRVGEWTMLEIAIRKLKNAGVDQIVINLHHFGQMIKEFLYEKDFFGADIRFSDESGLLLDTGGGLKHAAPLLMGNEPFFVYNVDILTNLDIGSLWDAHMKDRPLATLAIKTRPGSRFFLFDEDNRLSGWKNFETGEQKISIPKSERYVPAAFSGIHVIEPEIFALITESGVFSIVDTYLRLAASQAIKGFNHDKDLWFDLGKPEKVKAGSDAIEKYGLNCFID